MTDIAKEIKKMRRKELIETIYALQKSEAQLKEELATVKSQLESRNLKISEAGSIADAVVGLSGVFETAQAAADEYLRQVHEANTETEAQCIKMIEDAKRQAAETMSHAQEVSSAIKAQTDREIEEKWAAFQIKTTEVLRAHKELSDLLKE